MANSFLVYLATFLCGYCPEACSPTWVPNYHISPVWCSVAVKHPARVNATHKNLCCQRNEAPAATLETFKSRNQERELESSCSEICICQSQDIALWRRNLVKAASFPIRSSNLKYILSQRRLEIKLWLLTTAPCYSGPKADDHTPEMADTCLICASSLGILWPSTVTKIHIGQHEIPSRESGDGSQFGFLKMNKEKQKRRRKKKSKRDRVANDTFSSIALMGYRRKWHFHCPVHALWLIEAAHIYRPLPQVSPASGTNPPLKWRFLTAPCFLLKSSETALESKHVKLLTQLVPIIYPKSKSHLILMDTNSWDLAFPAQLKTDFALLGPTLTLFCQAKARHAFVQMLCSSAQGSSRMFFQVFEHPNSSNSLSATNEWWQWRLHCPIIHLPCLLMGRFPVTLDRPVLITLPTGSLSFSIAFRRKCGQSQKLCMGFFSVAKNLRDASCL